MTDWRCVDRASIDDLLRLMVVYKPPADEVPAGTNDRPGRVLQVVTIGLAVMVLIGMVTFAGYVIATSGSG